MSILFTDLDNTLIYSHNRELSEPKLVIEHLDGREQSFMTQFTYDFLSSADWLSIVPVTTRTVKQYTRIECVKKFFNKYAIVCNGGKLLVDGVEDEDWARETQLLAQDSYDCLEDAVDKLSFLCKDETLHRPEKYMCYTKLRHHDPQTVKDQLSEQVDLTKVDLHVVGQKFYMLSNAITKGKAIKRFMKRREQETVLSAGDGILDISMLDVADFAFPAPEIYEMVSNENRLRSKETVLSNGICKELNNMKEKGII